MASPPQFVTIILSDYCPVDNPYCQLPPPPPFSDDDNGTSIQIRDHHPNHLMTSFLIAAGSLLGLSFLLLLVFSAVLLRRRRLRRQQRSTPPPATDDAEPETEGGEGDTHHVWYIRTVGLDESIIASIASAEYKSEAGGGEDCAVCLGEFMDGEMVKMLPKCTHPFHVSCIDTWLRTHVNCPLCRAPVLLAEPTPADAAADPNDVQLDISDSDSDSPATSQTGTSNFASSLAGDLGDKSFQPVRRSVSVDSSTLAALLLRIEVHGKNPGYSQRRMLISEGAGLGKGLRKGPLAMKRSQSTRSGRFFFARCGRSRNNSILPL